MLVKTQTDYVCCTFCLGSDGSMGGLLLCAVKWVGKGVWGPRVWVLQAGYAMLEPLISQGSGVRHSGHTSFIKKMRTIF